MSKLKTEDILKLRYPSTDQGDFDFSRYLLPVKKICETLKITEANYYYRLSEYQRLLTAIKSSPYKPTSSEKRSLCSTTKLQEQATLSLKQRVSDFNLAKPNRKLTVKTLRTLYKNSSIRYKKVISKVRFRRNETEFTRRNDERIFQELKTTIRRAQLANKEIVMLDESCFSPQSYNLQAWAKKGDNITLKNWWQTEKQCFVIGAVSKNYGLIEHCQQPQPHTADSFLNFLKAMYKHYPQLKKAILLLDNCSVHHARKVQVYFNAEKIKIAWNKPYSPQFNGIELYWALAKKIFKTKVTQIKTGTETTTDSLADVVRGALESVPRDQITKCCNKALRQIFL